MEGLYAAEVPISERSGALADAFGAALAQVLVKVTGRRNVVADQSVMAKFSDPASLVQQYRIDPGNVVWVLFDSPAIKRILDEGGQPVWGAERPTTLIWLIVDRGAGEREILASVSSSAERTKSAFWNRRRASASGEDEIRDVLEAEAGRRAIPVVLPLVDSQEITAISVSEVWGGFAESLLAASDRYGVDAVLVGRATMPSLDQARVRWTLLIEGERYDWDSDLAGGPNELADFLAARMLTSVGAGRRLRLQVRGVSDLDDYGRLTRYLEGLDVVEDFAVDRVVGDEVVFSLNVRGDSSRLKRTIALRRVLEAVQAPSFAVDGRPIFGAATDSLVYQLSPAP